MVLSEQECIHINMVRFTGYRCYAGMRSLYISHDGDVYRCQADLGSGVKFCTVYDTYPELKAYTCPYRECTCEYYIPKEVKEGLADELMECEE